MIRIPSLMSTLPGLILVLPLLAACATPAARPDPAPRAAPGILGDQLAPGAAVWVEETLARLTLREKVGQLFMPWVLGDYLAEGGEEYERLRYAVQDRGVGGLIVSIGPPHQVAAKLNLMQGLADVPLLVAADMEHGPGQRLDAGVHPQTGLVLGSATRFPPVMALGAADDESLAYELGRVTALEGRAAGIHMTFAPVVDVNNNPGNPIINTRSYGEDPHSVARLATAHIRGLQDHGMLATAKHFPGHGDTEVDSHIDLPVIPVHRRRADAVELVPFRAAVDAGVAGVMSAHIAFPALIGDSTPATLSHRMMTGLLQEELGFCGLVVTDALDMGAIVRRYGKGEAAVLALEAGSDILLMPPDLDPAVEAVVAAVESGRVTESRIDHSVRKLLRAKAELGLHQGRTVSLDALAGIVGRPEHRRLARQAAERGLTLVRDQRGLVPVRSAAAKSALSIVYSDQRDAVTGRVFHQALEERFRELRVEALDERSGEAELDRVAAAADSADIVFFSPFVRVQAWKGHASIAEPVARLVDELATRTAVVVTSFGNPYLLLQFPRVGTYALAWGGEDVAQLAAARALTGEIGMSGRLPISLPPFHRAGEGKRLQPLAGDVRLPRARPDEVGMDARGLARVDSIIEAAIRAGVTPGAALAIGRHGRLVRLHGHGRLDRRPGFAAVTDSTIYDIASLTKVLGTTLAVMLLEEEGRIELDAPVGRYLPSWGTRGDRGRVTVRHLLAHISGLPAWAPLWRDAPGRDAALRRIAETPLEHAPGRRVLYSDLGMILLAAAAEAAAGEPLDRILHRRVFGPLGLRDTGFNPMGAPDPRLLAQSVGDGAEAGGGVRTGGLLARIAPTELDSAVRGVHVHGVVHDENAFALGGVAGHAGMFSSARDLAVLAQVLLNGGRIGDYRILDAATVRRYTAREVAFGGRVLGWELADGPRSSAGDYFSERSFGHTGFTGTSLWIDPERELFVVLLTNRLNPSRNQRGHIQLRRDVHDAVQQAITDAPLRARPDARVR